MDVHGLLQRYIAPMELDILRQCVWLVLLIAIFVPLERLCALHPQKVFRKAFGTDVVYFFLSGLAPKLLLILPMSVIAAVVHRVVPSAFYAWVAGMPLWVRLSAAMCV